MRTELSYDVTIDIVFTDEEFELLDNAICNNSQLRYAATVGNFWYGLKNSRPHYYNEGEDHICTFKRRQVDTVLIKSVEMLAQVETKYYAIYSDLMKALQKAIERNNELNSRNS